MKISNSGGPNLGQVDSAKSKGADALLPNKGEQKVKGAGDSAQVFVSERAQMMNKAKEIASRSDDVNSEKVARLQKLIDSGKYNINAEAIADKMVDEHMMLPSE